MATPSPRLIGALRDAANRIAGGSPYEWGHMGRCNCGHLAQSLTPLTADEIHALALRRSGDWSEQSTLYCSTSGLELDALIDLLLEAGLAPSDLRTLENLSDPRVLRRLPPGERDLLRNQRSHAVTYMRAWADLLEEQRVQAGEQPSAQPAGVRRPDAVVR